MYESSLSRELFYLYFILFYKLVYLNLIPFKVIYFKLNLKKKLNSHLLKFDSCLIELDSDRLKPNYFVV